MTKKGWEKLKYKNKCIGCELSSIKNKSVEGCCNGLWADMMHKELGSYEAGFKKTLKFIKRRYNVYKKRTKEKRLQRKQADITSA